MTQTRFHPWRRMMSLGPTWRLRWSELLPPDVYGFTDYPARTIILRSGMSFEERRCTITHEIEHVLRGPASHCSDLVEELEVNRRSARLLLPSLCEVADSLIYYRGDYELAADDLWVDPWTLEVRLSSLGPLEHDYWQRRMGDALLVVCDR